MKVQGTEDSARLHETLDYVSCSIVSPVERGKLHRILLILSLEFFVNQTRSYERSVTICSR
jgi:hypothetical protein